MRVLHINKRYFPHLGGVENHVRVLARGQSTRPGVAVDVLVVAEGPVGAERDDTVRVRRVPGWGTIASNPVSPALTRALVESTHDVWHFHYPFPTGEASLLIAEKFGRRAPAVVCTYHSDFVTQSTSKRALALPYAWLTGRFLKAVDAVIVSSPQMTRASRFLTGAPLKVEVIPFGIELDRLRASATVRARARELRARFPGPVILFVGRLVRYKGVDVLLRAMPYVSGSLVLVGDGPRRPALQAQAAALGLAGRVHFVGSVGDDELSAYYHAADVFVLPSVTPNEAFGLVQLEAHACGLPVVSTALPTGVPFANSHGESGIVVTPGDPAELAAALALLVDDEELRRSLGENARRRVHREFTTEVMVDRVLALYSELLPGIRP